MDTSDLDYGLYPVQYAVKFANEFYPDPDAECTLAVEVVPDCAQTVRNQPEPIFGLIGTLAVKLVDLSEEFTYDMIAEYE